MTAPLRSNYAYELSKNWKLELSEKYNSLKKTFFTREPLSRLVGSFRDKIQRLQGRDYFYEEITMKILALKYPNSRIPKNPMEWNFGIESNLTLTFQNLVEYLLGEELTGFDEKFEAAPGDTWVKLEETGIFGRRKFIISFDVHFDRQESLKVVLIENQI